MPSTVSCFLSQRTRFLRTWLSSAAPLIAFGRVFLFEGLLLQFFGDLGTLGARLGLFDHIVQIAPLFLGIESGHACGSVIRLHALAYTPIALPVHIARGKMQQGAVVRCANEVNEMVGRIHIDSHRVAQIGVEIRKARTVDDQVEFPAEARRYFGIEAHSGLRNVAVHDFDFVGQQRTELVAVLIEQRVENGRLLDHLFEALAGRVGRLRTNQQIKLVDFGQKRGAGLYRLGAVGTEVHQRVGQPYLADEAGHADQ